MSKLAFSRSFVPKKNIFPDGLFNSEGSDNAAFQNAEFFETRPAFFFFAVVALCEQKKRIAVDRFATLAPRFRVYVPFLESTGGTGG